MFNKMEKACFAAAVTCMVIAFLILASMALSGCGPAQAYDPMHRFAVVPQPNGDTCYVSKVSTDISCVRSCHGHR